MRLRLPTATWPVFLALFLFSALMVGAMVYVLRTGTRLTVRHTPLLKAAMEIRLEAGEGHLWLEEILSGDVKADVLDVWPHLDAADWYARAMMRGGTNEEIAIEPLDDPGLRAKIQEVRRRLADFREITALRLEQRAAPGTRIDQQYDAVFRDFVRLADEVENEIRAKVATDLQAFRRTQIAIIVGGLLLTGLVALVVAAHLAERARAEGEMGRLREELAQVTRIGLLGEMAAGIAHEVTQPLTAIATTAQAQRRVLDAGRRDDAEMRASLDAVVEQALRAGRVIRRLRTLMSRDRMRTEAVDLNALAAAARRLAATEAALARIRIRLDLDPAVPPVAADPVLIQQVLLNLIRNGAEAMNGAGPGEEIVIRTSPGGRTGIVEVAVEDRGSGVSPEAAQHLFQPFYTTKEEGFGMGLSLSGTIVAAHGGRLWFTNNPGGGATLHFTLLATREDPA
jgi:C4-dicarboxylate-specific signal transduction histidine kinase